MATKSEVQSAHGRCDLCYEEDVATLLIAGDNYCPSCFASSVQSDVFLVFVEDQHRCDSCGDTVDESITCSSCASHDDCYSSEDSHDDCSRECRNCGVATPELCEYCFLCQSCDKPMDEALRGGTAVIVHDTCPMPVVAAEPETNFEVNW